MLHTALRNRDDAPVMVDGADVMPAIRDTLKRMADFADQIRDSDITDVVNIGIGGSDLGPAMAVAALCPVSRRAALPFCIERGRGAYCGYAARAGCKNHAGDCRLQNLYHHRNHDQCAHRAGVDGGSWRQSGHAVCSPQHRRGQDRRVRHCACAGLRFRGLGGRALFRLGADWPVADDRHRAERVQRLSRWRLCHGHAIFAPPSLWKTCQ